jgi:hypothetical protein
MKARYLGNFVGLMLALAVFLGGCAGASPVKMSGESFFEGAGENFKQNVNHIMSSPNPDKWNPTDWGLWMESQGGG